MNMDLGNGLGHLSYSTLVHAGAPGRDARQPGRVRAPGEGAGRAGPAFGVSLRLSAASARELTARPDGARPGCAGSWPSTTSTSTPSTPSRTGRSRAVRSWSACTSRTGPPTSGSPTPARSPTCWPRSRPTTCSPSIQTAPLAFAPNVRGRSVRRPVHHPTAPRRGAPGRAGGADRAAGEARPRARAGLLPGDDRADRRLLRRAGPSAPPASAELAAARPGARLARRRACCAGISGWSSTSATSPSASRTSPPRWRAGRGRRPGLQAPGGGRALGRAS